MNKISVIIPTYNRAALIKRAVLSILNQTFPDFELIIVDDGSTDNTEEVVNSIHDDRIRYVRHEINKGHATAKNTGLEYAKCGLIAFQDSDDESIATRLEEEYKILSSFEECVGIVYSEAFRVEGGRRFVFPSPHYTLKDKNIFERALNYGVYNIALHACLVRKSVFDKIGGFDRGMKAFDDFEFFIRAARFFRFHCVKKVLAVYYYSEDSVSANKAKTLSDKKKIFCRYYGEMKKNAKILSTHLGEIGHSYCLCGNMKKGKGLFLKSLAKNLLNIKSLVLLFCALFGVKRYERLFIFLKRFYMRIYSFLREA